MVSGVQAAALPKAETEHHRIWEGKRIIIIRGFFKGYHGLVKTEDLHGVGVELDAKISSYGQVKQHFQFGEFQLECALCCLCLLIVSHKPFGQTYCNAGSIIKASELYPPSGRHSPHPHTRPRRT